MIQQLKMIWLLLTYWSNVKLTKQLTSTQTGFLKTILYAKKYYDYQNLSFLL